MDICIFFRGFFYSVPEWKPWFSFGPYFKHNRLSIQRLNMAAASPFPLAPRGVMRSGAELKAGRMQNANFKLDRQIFLLWNLG